VSIHNNANFYQVGIWAFTGFLKAPK
jgi:hypothetical protein